MCYRAKFATSDELSQQRQKPRKNLRTLRGLPRTPRHLEIDKLQSWIELRRRCARIVMTNHTNISPSTGSRHSRVTSALCLRCVWNSSVFAISLKNMCFLWNASTKHIAKLIAEFIGLFRVIPRHHERIENSLHDRPDFKKKKKLPRKRLDNRKPIKNFEFGASEQSSCAAGPNSSATGQKWKTWL